MIERSKKLFLYTMLLTPLIQSCGQGKSSAGSIGCAKTSSVLKSPQISVDTDSAQFEPDSDAQTSRFVKYFGGPSTKASGGYIYLKNRAANDPLGPVLDEYKRCSVVVEYPKVTGEKTLAQFDVNDRFSSYTDDIKIRIYTAAHCLDFSLTEEVTLSLFQVQSRSLPSFNDAYLNFKIRIPELESIKKLRANLTHKISSSFTADMAKSIMLSFGPRTLNLETIFGTFSGVGSPSSKNRCILKPENIGGGQYSCATYHDTAVFDVEPVTPFSEKQITKLRELRENQYQLTKNIEARSLFEYYVNDFFTRDLINSIFSEQTPAYNPILSTQSPCLNDAALNNGTRLFVFKKPPIAETDPNKKCVDFPITNHKTSQFFNYLMRERLRTFSQLNMIASVYKLVEPEIALQTCTASPASPQCAAKNDVQTALNELNPLLNLDNGSLANFLSTDSLFGKSMENVDSMIDAWAPFSNATPPTPADKFTLTVLNPLWNMAFHSNFIAQRNNVTTMPSANDVTLQRAFMTLPVKNIVGAETFPDSGERPILLESWNTSGPEFATGKFLRLFTDSSILDSFRAQFPLSFRFPQVEDYLVRPATLPTIVNLQKGDSGSIFSIDGIPIFALSTVNGEATSGGAAVRAIPVASEDTDDVVPQNTQNAGGGGGGGITSGGSGGGVTTNAVTCK